jgi:lipid-binding SYLF domain-containing protein
MKRLLTAVLTVTLVATAPVGMAADDKRAAKRTAIDTMAVDAIKRVFTENERARQLADRAVGYAVFDSFKAAFLVSGGAGVGVAVNDQTGDRTYMKMGTGGIGLGIGGQSYQIVFLFEDTATLEKFVNKGWQADASANAVAGTTGKNADATFTHGMAVFVLTNKGLMAQADISGTKYWKHKKLNL